MQTLEELAKWHDDCALVSTSRHATERHTAAAATIRAAMAALLLADEALRNHACHGGEKVPCIRTKDQCAADCGKEAGDALLAVEAALNQKGPAHD
jgi:hypothetical protein